MQQHLGTGGYRTYIYIYIYMCTYIYIYTSLYIYGASRPPAPDEDLDLRCTVVSLNSALSTCPWQLGLALLAPPAAGGWWFLEGAGGFRGTNPRRVCLQTSCWPSKRGAVSQRPIPPAAKGFLFGFHTKRGPLGELLTPFGVGLKGNQNDTHHF